MINPSKTLPPVLISGSMAFDTIMVFHGKFDDHILPDQVHILNVAFMVPTMRREFGGCAGNIAYNMALLGDNPYILAAVGKDFSSYHDYLTRKNIHQKGIVPLNDYYTAQAFITTDEKANQITAFHPGAMQEAHRAIVPTNIGAQWGIVSPNGKQAMMDHLQQMQAAKINTIFDPGQGLPMFSADDLNKILPKVSACTVNDYELKILCNKLSITIEVLAQRLPVLIVTLGEKGFELWEKGKKTTVAAINVPNIKDPTGCGDAFRAGLLHGLNLGKSWIGAAQLGNIVAAHKIGCEGGQNHVFSQADIIKEYHEVYGEAF